MAMIWIMDGNMLRSKVKVKFDSVNNLASNAAFLGPGSAVTNLSAIDGEPATSLDTSLGFKILVPLKGDKVACPICEKKEIIWIGILMNII